MFLKIARSIARPQAVAILDLIKRSTGLSVNELAKHLKLSYMGAKQYCNDLEKKGMLDTFRRPKEIGRPDMLYRLTLKAEAFYPEVGNELSIDLLESARQLYGPSAPDKLLFNFFTKKADAYLKKIKGSTFDERINSLAKLRDAEGYCTQVERDADQNLHLVEFHSLYKEIILAFPNIGRLEELMLSRVLGVRVERQETRVSGLVRITFQIDAPASHLGSPDHAMPETPAMETDESEFSPVAPVTEEIFANLPTEEVTQIEPTAPNLKDAQTAAEEEAITSVYNMLAPPPAQFEEQATPQCSLEDSPAPVIDSVIATPEQFAPASHPKSVTVETMELFENFRLVG